MDAARAIGNPVGVARSGSDVSCDLSDAPSVERVVRDLGPAVVFHAAAYTSVDGCEADPVAADRANRIATTNLVRALDGRTALVYLSTDQVYADNAGLKREGDEAPINVYGRSKLAGERCALTHRQALALRCNMFGRSRSPGRTGLVDWLVESLTTGRSITLFTDVLFSPLHVATLAALAVEAVARSLTGVFNVGCREGASKRDFAHSVAGRLGLSLASATDGRSVDVPGRARRPRDLRLDVSRFEAAMACRMPSLQEEVAKL
jgi:dTDP-4-dehydrorhamnose reductase